MTLAREFDDASLSIAWTPSATTKVCRVELEFEGPCDEVNVVSVWRSLLSTINHGGAGSDVFAPELGRMRILSGPLSDDVTGPGYVWEVEMGGVAEIFLRCIIERLTLVQTNRLLHLGLRDKICGHDPQAVDTDWIRAILKDPTAYPGVWPSKSLSVKRSRRSGTRPDLMVELTLGGSLTPLLVDELQGLVVRWLDAVSDFASDIDVTGEQQMVVPSSPLGIPKFARNRTTLRAYVEQFLHVREPAFSMLLNLAHYFHHRVASIAELTIVG